MQFSLKTLMGVLVVTSLYIGTLRYPYDLFGKLWFTALFLFLLYSAAAAIYVHRKETRPFWIASAIGSWGYALVAFGPWTEKFEFRLISWEIGHICEEAELSLIDNSLTYPPAYFSGNSYHAIQAGHCYFALLTGLVFGAIAMRVKQQAIATAAIEEPPPPKPLSRKNASVVEEEFVTRN